MTSALPDLQAYTITPQAADVIEDSVAELTTRPDLAPDGRIGMAGISFAGGLSLAAAGRPGFATTWPSCCPSAGTETCRE